MPDKVLNTARAVLQNIMFSKGMYKYYLPNAYELTGTNFSFSSKILIRN